MPFKYSFFEKTTAFLLFSALWNVERISLMTNSSEDLPIFCSFISMTIHIYIYKHVSPSNKVKCLLKKLLNPLTEDFCIVQQKRTRWFFTQLHIWPTEFYLHCISKLLVGTPVHGKYLCCMNQENTHIFKHLTQHHLNTPPVNNTTAATHCCLTDPAPKGYKTKLQYWVGGRV